MDSHARNCVAPEAGGPIRCLVTQLAPLHAALQNTGRALIRNHPQKPPASEKKNYHQSSIAPWSASARKAAKARWSRTPRVVEIGPTTLRPLAPLAK
jgi:hypothetical protein